MMSTQKDPVNSIVVVRPAHMCTQASSSEKWALRYNGRTRTVYIHGIYSAYTMYIQYIYGVHTVFICVDMLFRCAN
jgi:hypothetical protein